MGISTPEVSRAEGETPECWHNPAMPLPEGVLPYSVSTGIPQVRDSVWGRQLLTH